MPVGSVTESLKNILTSFSVSKILKGCDVAGGDLWQQLTTILVSEAASPTTDQ